MDTSIDVGCHGLYFAYGDVSEMIVAAVDQDGMHHDFVPQVISIYIDHTSFKSILIWLCTAGKKSYFPIA